MIRAGIDGIGVWGPGLPGWTIARTVLRGETPPVPDQPPPPPALLPSNERRRTSDVVRLALHVADQAVSSSGHAPDALLSVFASANGDGPVVHGILEALAIPGGDVSPTAFHNSVHNAAAGYWTIGHRCPRPATCLGAYDATWAAGLVKAFAELRSENEAVLLVVYDAPIPPPLHAKRPTGCRLGVAMVLSPEPGKFGTLTLALGSAVPPDTGPGFVPLPDCENNPATHALPLLQAIATGQTRRLMLPYLDQAITLDYTP